MSPLQRSATFNCPHCSVLSLHTALGLVETKKERLLTTGESPSATRELLTVHVVFECVACKEETYCIIRYEKDPKRDVFQILYRDEWSEALESGRGSILYRYPPVSSKPHEAVNMHVAAATIEAEKCLAVGAYNACAVMTRRAIHSLCEDKKAQGKDLFAQLADLKTKQLITPDLHEWADSLRVLGRDGAHPEFPEVTQSDAEDGVKLLREIIKFVYILPFERAEKRRSK